MSFATLAVLVVLVVTGLFAALNWPAFTAPMTLFVGLTTVELPLGLLLLCVLGLVSALFLVAALTLQGRAMAELRRHGRELQAQRQLADQAEASRFTELREFMAAELERVARSSDAVRDTLLARLDRMESQQRLLIEQTGNTLSSYIGELEDRFDRGAGGAGGRGH